MSLSSYEDMVDEYLHNEIEEAAWEDGFVWNLLKDEYVDEKITKEKLAIMFKAYCRVYSSSGTSKENAEKDLLLMTKSLMKDMYQEAYHICNERNV